MKRDDIIRRLIARFGRDRWNEHVKLLATLFNGLAIAAWVGAVVAPNVSASNPSLFSIFVLASVGLFSHLAAHFVMRYFAANK